MNFKDCNSCKDTLPTVNFNKTLASSDGYDWKCRECNKKYLKAHYRANIDSHKSSRKTRKVTNNISNRVWVYKYLMTHPCPCGESRPECLDFDHLNPKEKRASISEMFSKSLSMATIQKEIGKCQVLCSNCHRVKTAKDNNWYKNIEEMIKKS